MSTYVCPGCGQPCAVEGRLPWEFTCRNCLELFWIFPRTAHYTDLGYGHLLLALLQEQMVPKNHYEPEEIIFDQGEENE